MSWEGLGHRHSHPGEAAGTQRCRAEWSANRSAVGVPAWPRLPGVFSLLRQNRRGVFASLCFAPTKGWVRVEAGLCSATGRPWRSLCQRRVGSLGAPRAQTSHRFPGPSGPFFSVLAFPFPKFLHTFSPASGPACQGERCPCAGRARAGCGRQGSWHRKGKKKEKAFQPSLLVRKPEGMRNGPFGAQMGI